MSISDNRRKEIHRLLGNKGFGLPQVSWAEHIIDDEINDKQFRDSILVCENCSLGCDYVGEKVLGEGPITSPVMLVGDFTKEDDENAGLPFCGPAGFVLTMALQNLGIDRRCLYITNAIKCKCHTSPTPDDLATCKPYLEYEINRIKPKYIITFGNTALKSVTNNFEMRISQFRGSVLMRNDITIYPTWHPDYLIGQNGMDFKKATDEFIYDLKNAFEQIQKEFPTYRWKL